MTFKSVRRNFYHTEEVHGTCEEVFPLFCPVKSFEWIADWSAQMIYSESGYAEPGCVFKTYDPYEGEETWIISEYIFPSEIKFVRMNSLRTIIHSIFFYEKSKNRTIIEFCQEITGLNSQGNEFTADLEKSEFVEMTEVLACLLNNYLKDLLRN
ncbi:MAG: hypothetical protein ACQEQS_09395 [Thermodesulfobacteriota bacterium]